MDRVFQSLQSAKSLNLTGQQGSGKTTLLALTYQLTSNAPTCDFSEKLALTGMTDNYRFPGSWIYESPNLYPNFDEYVKTMFKRLRRSLPQQVDGNWYQRRRALSFLVRSEIYDLLKLFSNKEYASHFFDITDHDLGEAAENKRIILVFDVLDRLNADEIKLLLKVKIHFDSSNHIKVVLIYDEPAVLKILQSEYSYFDKQYLQKYVDPRTTDIVELTRYSKDWEQFINDRATALERTPDELQARCIQQAISNSLKSSNTEITAYGAHPTAIRSAIQKGLDEGHIQADPILNAYLELPKFGSDKEIYTSDFVDEPLESLYINEEFEVDYEELMAEFKANVQPTSQYQGLYCSTIFCEYIPNWRTTNEAILKAIDEEPW